MKNQILQIKNVTMKFGNLVANDSVSFDVNENEIVSLIGPNGAGKTTLFNCITNYYTATSGNVIFDKVDVTNKSPNSICKLGLTRTFQIVKTLKDMTVHENVLTGAFCRTNRRKEAEEITDEILNFTNLHKKRHAYGGSLTIEDKKLLEIARALATKPKMIMLDEAMAGLNQTEIKEAMNLILKIRNSGITVLVVEHIMEAIMPISDKIVVLNAGKKIAEDIPERVVNNEDVIKAYLGDRYHDKSKKS